MSLSGAKRKAEESSNEGGSRDAAMLTSPRASPAKSRARCEDEKKKQEEEEASNRISPPLQDVVMQDPPRDKGAADVEVEAHEVPAIEVVGTTEVPAIEAERTRAEPTEGVRSWRRPRKASHSAATWSSAPS